MTHIQFECDNDLIFSMTDETYPPYRPGDIIWLEATIEPIGQQIFKGAYGLKLTRFRVYSVEYYIQRIFGKTIVDIERMEVVLIKEPIKLHIRNMAEHASIGSDMVSE